MEKALCAQVAEILEALPEGTDEAAVLRRVFESQRKKNALLSKIIRGETTCAKEISCLVAWTNSLKWNAPALQYDMDEDLKRLVEIGEWNYAPRAHSWYVRCDDAYEPAEYGRAMMVAVCVLILVCFFTVAVWAPFLLFSSPPIKSLLGLVGVLYAGLVFFCRISISKYWISNRKRIAENVLVHAKRLDEKIQLAYIKEV